MAAQLGSGTPGNDRPIGLVLSLGGVPLQAEDRL